jgi:hypothetical protein
MWISTQSVNYYSYVLQILEKKWQYNEAVHQLFIDFAKVMIQLGGRSCIIFSLSLVSHEVGKTNKTVSE